MNQYFPLGDSAIIIKAGQDISPETNAKVRKWLYWLDKIDLEGIMDIVPAYNEIMIVFDDQITEWRQLLKYLKSNEQEVETIALESGKMLLIPVVYGDGYGPDLEYVAKVNKLTEDQVIEIHQKNIYQVYMQGFTPGFCYLGGLDKRLFTPRKSNPSLNIQAGSVGIADQQTGIYPVESPGGWQIIGRTPFQLFAIDRDPVFLFRAGDFIQFKAISEYEFNEIQKLVLEGAYTYNWMEME